MQHAFCLVIASASLYNLSCCQCRVINQKEIGLCVLGIDAVWFGKSDIPEERKLKPRRGPQISRKLINKVVYIILFVFFLSFLILYFVFCYFFCLFIIFYCWFIDFNLICFNMRLLFVYFIFFFLFTCLSCFSPPFFPFLSVLPSSPSVLLANDTAPSVPAADVHAE